VTVRVELVNGPCDGLIWEIPALMPVIVVHQPAMTAEEFIAAEEKPSLLEFATMGGIELAYKRDQTALSQAGYQRYIYAGVRQQ
jgi:hypothetical protein